MSVEGMTVLNTSTDVNAKKQPMFFGALWESRDMTSTSIQSLINSLNNNSVISGDLKRFLSRKIAVTIRLLHQNRNTSSPANLKYQIMLDSVQGRGPGMCFLSLTAHSLN